VTITSERTRLALVPLMLPFAGAWLLAWRPPREAFATQVVTLAVAAGLVLTPVLPERKRRDDLDERDFNLAVALLSEPADLDGADALARELAERHPSSPRVLVLAAEVDYRLARRLLDASDASEEELERAGALLRHAQVRLERASTSERPRERFQADALAGAVLQFLGRWGEAGERYRAALRFDPADRDLRRRLAVCVAERAMLAPDAATRRAGLDEALALVAALRAEAEEVELERLEAKLRGARDG
jgi:tetratricopeptide (TPR) repeat protein